MKRIFKVKLDCKDSNLFPLATLTSITKYWLFNATGTRTIVKKIFFKRQTMTNRVKGFDSFLKVFSFVLGKFIALKMQSTTSIIHRILRFVKVFYLCKSLLMLKYMFISFHFISFIILSPETACIFWYIFCSTT